MAQIINQPTEVKACGNKTKIIKEFIGRINSNTEQASIAQMESPQGWEEPGQTPEFDVKGGQAVIAFKGGWIQYSSSHEGGAKYIAVCLPAFSPDSVHRDA